MNLRAALATKGVEKLSVTALLGLARNTQGLEFDKQTLPGSTVPDTAGIEMKLDELLERLAKKHAAERAQPDIGGEKRPRLNADEETA